MATPFFMVNFGKFELRPYQGVSNNGGASKDNCYETLAGREKTEDKHSAWRKVMSTTQQIAALDLHAAVETENDLVPKMLKDLYSMECFDWKELFEGMTEGITELNPDTVIYVDPDSISKLCSFFHNVTARFNIEELYDFLLAEAFCSNAAGDPWTQDYRDVYDIPGCIKYLEKKLPLALGRFIVDQTIDEDNLPILLALFQTIVEEYRQYFESAPYLDTETLNTVLDKLNALSYDHLAPFAFPNYVYDQHYKRLNISDSFYFNDFHIRKFDYMNFLREVNQPWKFGSNKLPSAVRMNALYTENAITIDLGNLRPPFFHKDYPVLYNIASLAPIMANAVGHAFGERYIEETWSGSKMLHNEAFTRNIDAEKKCLMNMYSNVCAEYDTDTVCLQPNKTVEEDWADQLGHRIAYQAYQTLVQRRRLNQTISGFENLTTDQMFFVIGAQWYCGTQSFDKEAMLEIVQKSRHSSTPMRNMGMAMNSRTFQKAFNCKPGDKLHSFGNCPVFGQLF